MALTKKGDFVDPRTEMDRLRDFAELSADWFWEQDAELRFTRFSGVSLEKLKRQPQSFFGLRRWDLPIADVDTAELAAHRATCERHQAFRDFEYGILDENGDISRYRISGRPLFDAAGCFIGYRGVGRNITDLHQARQTLVERDATLAQIVDGSPVAMFVIDASHRVSHWNYACAALTGRPAAEMLGRDDAWRGFYPAPRPTLSDLLLDGADIEALRVHYGNAVVPSALIVGGFEAEARIATPAGDERWLFFTAAPLRDGRGRIIGALETLQDISDRRRHAAAMEALLAEQALIFDNALIGISYQKNRIIERCNRRLEEMFGWAPGELVGQSTRVLFATEADWQAAGERVYRCGDRYDDDMSYVRKDGSAIVIHIVGRSITDDRGTTWVWTYEDVTEKARVRAERERLFREQTRIFEGAGTGIAFTRDRIIQRCNPAFAAIFGWTPEELTGQPTRLLFTSADAWREAGALTAAALSVSSRYVGDMDFVNRRGEPLRCQITGSWLNPDDHDEGVVWLFADVTEKRRTAAALERLLAEHAMIFDNALVGIAFTRDRIILRCNRRLEEITGYPPGGLLGQPSQRLFADEEEWLAAGHRYALAANSPQGIRDEVRFRRHDGAIIWVRVSGRTVRHADDEFWIWTYQDITRRRLAEEELRHSHQQLEQRVAERTAELSSQLHFLHELIEAIPGPVFYKDRRGTYLGCNRAFAEFLGRPREDIVGRDAFGLAPRHLAETYQAADEALYTGDGRQIYEARVKSSDGTERDVMFHKAVYRDAAGHQAGLIGVMLDISERIAMEARLRQSATVFDSTADGVIITDSTARVIAVNRAFTEITGYAEAEILGNNPRLLQSGRQDSSFYQSMWETVTRHGCWRGEVWNRRRDGSEYAEWLTISTVADKSGAVSHYVGVFSDITGIKQARERLDHQAHHDALTGLPNRLLLEDRSTKALSRARREQGRVALLFIDLDRFKNINDTLGHHVGDLVLGEVARRIGEVLRETDTLARLGGDEFVVLLEDIDEPAAASRVADKIIDSLRRQIVSAGQEFFIGASIGISLFPDDGEDAASLLKNADAAMYRAKDRGRNTFEFFTTDLTAVSLERFRLEVDIRHAINRGELRPYFQSQFRLSDGGRIGAEALLRWQHPRLGMVSPARFIPLAEESGLIVALGEWMLRAACTAWAGWIAQGHAPGVLSVNVSGVEFRRGHVLNSVRAALAESGLAADRLSLEITESAMMNQTEGAIGELHALRALGVQLAIDDFGTGYSSLAYLKRLPLHKLKIDQGFVRGLPDDENDAAITRAVIALARSLEFTTVAEGVETEAQATFLRDAGCDEMQGFLRARPLSAADFEAALAGS